MVGCLVNWKRSWNKIIVAYWNRYSDISLEGIKKTKKNICPGELNQNTPKHKPRALALEKHMYATVSVVK
jgi:hypothetical protein